MGCKEVGVWSENDGSERKIDLQVVLRFRAFGDMGLELVALWCSGRDSEREKCEG